MDIIKPTDEVYTPSLENQTEEVEYHSFSTALEALKEGNRATRENWNGPNQYIALLDESEEMDRAYIYIKTVNGEIVPWVATQSDLLADDWTIL